MLWLVQWCIWLGYRYYIFWYSYGLHRWQQRRGPKFGVPLWSYHSSRYFWCMWRSLAGAKKHPLLWLMVHWINKRNAINISAYTAIGLHYLTPCSLINWKYGVCAFAHDGLTGFCGHAEKNGRYSINTGLMRIAFNHTLIVKTVLQGNVIVYGIIGKMRHALPSGNMRVSQLNWHYGLKPWLHLWSCKVSIEL